MEIARAGDVWMEWGGGYEYETRRYDPKYPHSPFREGGAATDMDGTWVVWTREPSFHIVDTESDAVQELWRLATKEVE